VGIFLFPSPGGLNDFFEGRVSGYPVEGFFEFFAAGNEDGGIAGAARAEFAWDLAAGDALGGADDFENGKAAAVADVEGFAGDAIDFLEGADVRVGDVEDVDVVSNASAVGGGVVSAEDVDMRQIAGGGIEDAGDEMRFDAMVFAAVF
jgi:hypothetical protein